MSQLSPIELPERLQAPRRPLAKLVTPFEARTLPVHRWFLYPHSYSPGLVKELLNAFQLSKDAVVYDPFSGAGTTVRTAQEEGYSAFGTDILPLSVLLSRGKTARYSVLEMERAWQHLQARLRERPFSNGRGLGSDIPLVNRAFSPEIQQLLSHVRASIYSEPLELYRDFFLIALARLVDHASLAVKSGGWPRIVERDIDPNSISPTFLGYANAMIDDVRNDSASSSPGNWDCFLGDSTLVPGVGRYSAIITSPPYLNRHDYTRVLGLEHALVFGTSQEKLIALRRGLLRSHVEARAQRVTADYRTPTELAEVLRTLKMVLEDRRVYPMVTGYFEDMFRTLAALRTRLEPDGYVAFVLGDVRFGGVMLPVEAAVRQLGEQVGLQWLTTWQARERGNSAQQMKKYGREPAREYVIIWRMPQK